MKVAENILVYVVDDEPLITESVGAMLASDGFDVALFLDPAEALEAMEDAPLKPSVLFTDFMMSPINGLELIEAARTIHPSIKTILCSGNLGQAQLLHMPKPPDLFIPKPFKPAELGKQVRSVL